MKRLILYLILVAICFSAYGQKKGKVDPENIIFADYRIEGSSDDRENGAQKAIVNKVLKPYYEKLNCQEAKKDKPADIIISVSTSDFAFKVVGYNYAVMVNGKPIPSDYFMKFKYQISYFMPTGEYVTSINGSFSKIYNYSLLSSIPTIEIPELGSIAIRTLVPAKTIPISEWSDLRRLGIAPVYEIPKKPSYTYFLNIDVMDVEGTYVANIKKDIDKYFEKEEKKNLKRTDSISDADYYLDMKVIDYKEVEQSRTFTFKDDNGNPYDESVKGVKVDITYYLRVFIPSGWANIINNEVYSFTDFASDWEQLPVADYRILTEFPGIDNINHLTYAQMGNENRINRAKDNTNNNLFMWTGKISPSAKNNPYLGMDATALQSKVTELNNKINKLKADKVAIQNKQYRSDNDPTPNNIQKEIFLVNQELKIVYEAMDTSGNDKLSEPDVFDKVTKLAEQYLNDEYLKPRDPVNIGPLVPKKIEMRELPPVPTIVKDQFETTQEFEGRVSKAKQDRQEAVETVQKEYAMRVMQRNNLIQSLENFHNDELDLIAEEQEIKKQNLAYVFPEMVNKAFSKVMSFPAVKDLQYDADNQTMHGVVYSTGANYSIRFTQAMTADEAKLYFANQSLILPVVAYKVLFDLSGNLVTNQQLQLSELRTYFNGKMYPAQLSTESFQPKQISFQIVEKKLDVSADNQLDLSMQDPMLVDRVMVAEMRMRDKSINPQDDLTDLIARLPQAPEEDNRWLFVIGIENYNETQPVDFSVTSASSFVKVAKKKFGIKDSHIYSLFDEEATTTTIKNKLSLMLDRVEDGDIIYFYYSGHGMPSKDPSQDRMVEYDTYLIPVDGMPNLIYHDSSMKTTLIYKQLTDSKAAKVICFVDACFSGGSDFGSLTPEGELAAALLVTKPPTYDKSKMALFSAALGGQTARSYPEKGHRLFSYFLAKSLIENPIENLTAQQLHNILSEDVHEVSYDRGDSYRQDPELSGRKDITFN